MEIAMNMSKCEIAEWLISPYRKTYKYHYNVFNAQNCYSLLRPCDQKKVISEIIRISNGRVSLLLIKWLMENTTFPIIAVPASKPKNVEHADDAGNISCASGADDGNISCASDADAGNISCASDADDTYVNFDTTTNVVPIYQLYTIQDDSV